MKVCSYRDIPAEPVREAGARGVTIRWLITPQDGRTDFCMRHFDVEPGGYTPEHAHPWEHQVFILEGEGTVLGGTETRPFAAGDVVFVAPNERHQFRNTGATPARFLCLIPSPKTCSL